MTASTWLGGLDLPVRLVAVPEGALQGFNDEVLDLDHETFARECAIDIPGPETDELGRLARKWGVFVIAQAKARHPEFPGRYFNVGFVLDPDGAIVLRHHKLVPLLPVEHSMTPHNVFDRWVELYGETLDAFYPVADTAIGRLGIMMANEGSYPENARGLALNGAEVIYAARPTAHEVIKLKLDLLKNAYQNYLIVLENAQQHDIWRGLLQSTTAGRGSAVVVRLPSRLFVTGQYKLILSGTNNKREYEVISEFSVDVIRK